VYMLRVNL